MLIETGVGSIELEIDLQHAPLTGCNFLRYVARGAYQGGAFRRTVRADNQVGAKTPIAVIQGYANPDREPDALGPIHLERTRETGLRHRNGTVSMARAAVNDATSEFFICIGDQPPLDYGGKRNPDGQGFAAFGRVISGMDIVRRIHEASAHGESLDPPIPIQRARILMSSR